MQMDAELGFDKRRSGTSAWLIGGGAQSFRARVQNFREEVRSNQRYHFILTPTSRARRVPRCIAISPCRRDYDIREGVQLCFFGKLQSH